MQKQLETYFRRYILDVRKLKETSAKHYAQALRTVSRYLREAGLIADEVYEVDSISELRQLKQALLAIPAFVEQDEVGNRMYSAGLNRYLEFTELRLGAEPQAAVAGAGEMALLDTPVAAPARQYEARHHGWNRDRIIVEQVLGAAHFTCEVDAGHQTFITAARNVPYLEAHHLIPLHRQPEFGHSLDVYANIAGVCPTCHRLLHHGRQNEVRAVLSGFYDRRSARLAASGLALSKDEFLGVAAG